MAVNCKVLGTKIVALAGVTAIDVRMAGTVRRTVADSIVLPEVPVTVIGCVPLAAEEPTITVRVDAPVAVIEPGLKLTVTPGGTAVADKAIVELKPPVGVLLMVDVPELPCATVIDTGDAERMKPGLDEFAVKSVIRPDPFGLPNPVAKS